MRQHQFQDFPASRWMRGQVAQRGHAGLDLWRGIAGRVADIDPDPDDESRGRHLRHLDQDAAQLPAIRIDIIRPLQTHIRRRNTRGQGLADRPAHSDRERRPAISWDAQHVRFDHQGERQRPLAGPPAIRPPPASRLLSIADHQAGMRPWIVGSPNRMVVRGIQFVEVIDGPDPARREKRGEVAVHVGPASVCRMKCRARRRLACVQSSGVMSFGTHFPASQKYDSGQR